MAIGKMADIAGAEKKLRQAEYFLELIERWSKNPAFLRSGGNPEDLEFLFSAALSAARSVFYVLVRIDKQKSKVIYGKWLDGLGSEPIADFRGGAGLREVPPKMTNPAVSVKLRKI
jgi:hypothetical protein